MASVRHSHKEIKNLKSIIPFFLGALLALAPMTARADDAANPLEDLIKKQAPSIVTVKAVLKMQMKMSGQSRDTETRMELLGTVVSPDGLIMVSNAPFDTKSMMQMMGSDSSDFQIKISPTDFKVVIGSEEKQYTGFMAGADTTVGMAFIKIEDLGDRTLQPVEFASADRPAIGDNVYAVGRLSKGYDYAPFLEDAVVVGHFTKPKEGWVVSGTQDVGVPVFTASGKLLGASTMVASGVSDSGTRSMSVGSHLQPFLLPASTFTSVIALAKQQAVTVGAKRAQDKAAKPATPATPATPTAPVAPATKPAK